MDAFCQLLTSHIASDSLEPGQRLSFFWSGHEHDEVMIEINGKVAGTLKSRAVCWALFDTYLGSEPVSASAKQAFIDGISALGRGAAQ